ARLRVAAPANRRAPDGSRRTGRRDGPRGGNARSRGPPVPLLEHRGRPRGAEGADASRTPFRDAIPIMTTAATTPALQLDPLRVLRCVGALRRLVGSYPPEHPMIT